MNVSKTQAAAGVGGVGGFAALIALLPEKVQPYAVIGLAVVFAAVIIAEAIIKHGPIGKALAEGVSAVDDSLLKAHDKSIAALGKNLVTVSTRISALENAPKAPSTEQQLQAIADAAQAALAHQAAPSQPPSPPAA